MTLPTRMPILPAPTSRPACTAAAMVARSASVAASSALRLRARSAASAGLRQAIRRSSGKSGWVISARFAWSNRLICGGPSSRASAATSGARRAVTQPRPPRSRSCSIRALVIIPRSPTSTRSVNPKRSRTSVARWANAVGRPVAVRVVAGNTADPTAFAHLATDVRDRFGLTDLVLVGDRGMITKARIEQLRDLGGLGWVTALRAPDVAALARDDGPLQMSLFDQANLAEITHPDFPDERLIACRNPALAADRARNRSALLAATEADLATIAAAVQ